MTEELKPEVKEVIETSRFQLLAGSYIGGKIFLDYVEGLQLVINPQIKGERSKFNRLEEARAKVKKAVQLCDVEITSAFGNIGPTDNVVDYLTQVINEVLMLTDTNQKRVLGLMQKLNREQEKNIK